MHNLTFEELEAIDKYMSFKYYKYAGHYFRVSTLTNQVDRFDELRKSWVETLVGRLQLEDEAEQVTEIYGKEINHK